MEINELLDKVLPNYKSIEQLHGGMMNKSYLVTTDEKRYIVYIPGNSSVDVNRELEFFAQDSLSKIGITSKNFYFDKINGIKINEFISGTSLDKIDEFDYEKVASLLKKLHDYKPKANIDYKPFVRLESEYEPNAKKHGYDLGSDYLRLKELLFSNREYLENIPTVLSHNDFQRSNIIKGSDDNYYVIDFEFLMDNDPIYDIAAFGNGIVMEGRTLLSYYYLDKLTDDEIKRFYLWRIYLSLQWYLVAINKHFNGEGKIHNFDFLMVAKHFLDNALEAEKMYKKELQ